MKTDNPYLGSDKYNLLKVFDNIGVEYRSGNDENGNYIVLFKGRKEYATTEFKFDDQERFKELIDD